jgi:hypothetical protein
MTGDPTETQAPDDDIDAFLAQAFGPVRLAPKKEQSPEQDFMNRMTAGTVNKLGNLRYYLNSHELPKFQFMRQEKGIAYTVDGVAETKQIPGAVSAKPLLTKVQRDITREEYIKHSIEYYLCMHYLPFFLVDERNPHRPVCSLSRVVDMLAEHDDIKELRTKKY